MARSKTYWKDIRQALSSSKGRVASIVSLMALGSFALVGLKVTAPDIRSTGQHFFETHQTADLFLVSNYGLNASDQAILDQIQDKAAIEYGYFTDATIQGTDTALRLFSQSETLSQYAVVAGHLPTQAHEIALSAAYQDRYQLGDTIQFTEKAGTKAGPVLTTNSFTITGFVNSSELLSRINLGRSTAGTGNLEGYAVLSESAFDSEVYMIARIGYPHLAGLNPFEQAYLNQVYADKQEVQALFNLQSADKLAQLTDDYQRQINDGHRQLDDAKQELAEAASSLASGESEIARADEAVASGQTQLDDSEGQLNSAQTQLSQAAQTLADSANQLQASRAQLDSGWASLTQSKAQLDEAASQLATATTTLQVKQGELAAAQAQLTAASSQIDSQSAELVTAKAQLDQAQADLAAGQSQLDQAKAALVAQISQLEAVGIDSATVPEVVAAQATIASQEAILTQGQADYAINQAAYEAGVAQLQAAQAELAQGQAQYAEGQAQLEAGQATLTSKQAEYATGLVAYQVGLQTLNAGEAQYRDGLARYEAGQATYQANLGQYESGVAELTQAKATLQTKKSQLDEAKATLAQKQAEYADAKAKADPEIADKERELADAQEKVDQLTQPTYSVYTRREVPGSEGYLSYENNASIIDAVGNIFPIILYLVAALVTFTTMTRFVDEERLKIGTFKALGYTDHAIIRKYVLYGAVTSMIGTAIGTLLGHTLLPYIIYTTYSSKIILSPIELSFYPGHTLAAIVLGLVSAVLPTILVARKELAEKPAQLLLPKPPVSGSSIFLERITPLWRRLSFTQKVTARNIFRYKQRMLMTIFGVCGSIALLFTGLGVQNSVADLNHQQFERLIQYDLIVAQANHLTASEQADIERQLAQPEIEQSMKIHYETLTKVAGQKNDSQSVTLIVPEAGQDNFQDYIQLVNRTSRQPLTLDDQGAIISEKFAALTGAKVGDNLTFKNRYDEDVTVRVSGITEMYMNHFIFMTPDYYQQVVGYAADSNAVMVQLVDSSTEATNQAAAEFMNLSGVQTVVQNTTLKEQVKTIVNSVNRVMYILIITSALLAIVILYNLTNINVAERMRELCTIKVLGFHNQEVTLYIYRETIILSLLGILAGFGAGLLLHRYMIQVIPPEVVMFNPAVNGLTYLIPSLLVVGILAILGLVVTKWLRRVDMLEALKSVE